MNNEEYREYEKEYEEINSVEEDKDYPDYRKKDECGEIKIYTRCVHIHVNCKHCGVKKNR